MFPSLRKFIAALDAEGLLHRVTRPVNPVLEIAAIVDQECRSRAPGTPSDSARRNDPMAWDRGGRALLFEKVEGSDVPLLINAFGSYRRMEMALGCHEAGHTPGGFEAIADRIAALTKPVPPRNLAEAVQRGRQLLPLLKVVPKTVSRGICQQVVHTGEDIDLTRLPLLRCWPLDGDPAAVGHPPDVNRGVPGLGHPHIRADEWEARFRGRYITLAGVHTIHPDDLGEERPASHNIGMYRAQLLGRDRLAMHWHVHHDGATHWRAWKRRGQPMPVAIVLGGESVLPYAATCPLPPGISELLMAGFLNRSGIPLVPGRTVPLRVPANAEIVIEGFVSEQAGPIGWDPRDPAAGPLGKGAVFEGPFGDHTGFYSLPDRYPVMRVTAVTTRRDPVYPTTIVGLPPQEDYFLGKATERVMGALLKIPIHDVQDYDLPMFGAFHNCACVRIHKEYPLQARRLMHAVWGTGQMAWTKSIFVVEEGTEVHDAAAVLEACARRCHPGRDVEMVRGPLDILDHAAPHLGAGTKLGFDCTSRWPGEEAGGPALEPLPEALAAEDAGPLLLEVEGLPGVMSAGVPAPGWLFLRVDRGLHEPEGAGLGLRALQAALEITPDGGALPYLVAVGRDVDLSDPVAPFFHWLANMDAGRDCLWSEGRDRLAFDATPKTAEDARNGEPVREWPPIVSHPPEVVAAARRLREEEGLAASDPAAE